MKLSSATIKFILFVFLILLTWRIQAEIQVISDPYEELDYESIESYEYNYPPLKLDIEVVYPEGHSPEEIEEVKTINQTARFDQAIWEIKQSLKTLRNSPFGDFDFN